VFAAISTAFIKGQEPNSKSSFTCVQDCAACALEKNLRQKLALVAPHTDAQAAVTHRTCCAPRAGMLQALT